MRTQPSALGAGPRPDGRWRFPGFRVHGSSLKVFGLLLGIVLPAGAEFPTPHNTEARTNAVPLSAAEAAARMGLPPGFKAGVFAAEPDVQNPIGLSWDGRGRLWIAENYTYAEGGVRYELKLRDRILIFEDRDGDGRFDSRKVFTDELQMLTSVEVGHGGVWALSLPQLVFIPDRNGDDVPDGPAEVLLDGFNPPQENHHNIANGLRFGPDGWLYGRCGASGPADVGAPGTPAARRIPVRGGMWRYHPQRRVFEAITSGNTNPWGHDWNERGELFYVNTVNGHLWHAFAGAHFVRPHTVDPNPRAYALIDMHADHWHFDTGKAWSDSRDGAANQYGGGHSHIGAMVYLGDNWPAAYRGRLFTLNQHGRRANQEILERSGSGYLAKHGQDTLLSADTWFRGLDLGYGPDGGVYVLDWSDTGECHERDGVHRTSGRIYKVTHGEPKPPGVGDLTKLGARELVRLHTHANEWFARQARLELTARVAGRRSVDSAAQALREMFERDASGVHKLRALWSLYAIGAADEMFLKAQLGHADEHVRTWAVRLLSDRWPLDTLMSQRPAAAAGVEENRPPAALKDFIRLAREDQSAFVRLALASALQRLPVSQRPALAAALVVHAGDATDHNLPLMIWYGLIPVGDGDPAALATIAADCALPDTRRLIARRLAEDIEKTPAPINDLLSRLAAKPVAFQADILNGIAEGLTGWRKARKPAAWDALAQQLAASANDVVRDRVRDLSVLFGDGRALDEVKRVALNKDAHLNTRKAALQTLIDSRPPDLRQTCEQLLGVRFLNPVAARGLATFDDPAVGQQLVKAYRQFHQSERPQLIATLVSRPSFVKPLLDAVAEGRIPRTELSAFHVRQIRSLNDPVLNRRLVEAWGELRESTADKQQLVARLKQQLTPAVLAQADRSQGRAVYQLACANCHRLYGQGAEIGPDLTGAGRDNLDYLLENIADPSAVVTADFRMSVLNLKDGRVLNGVIKAKTDRTLTLQAMTEKLTVERSEVVSLQESTLSLMPEGLLEALNPTQVRDLIAYLMNLSQVPLPAGSN